MSGEALQAYRTAMEDQIHYYERVIPADQMDAEILKRFAFFEPEVKLVVGFSPEGQLQEIFHYAGTVVFKGFEKDAPCEMWEMVNLLAPFGQMLAKSPKVLKDSTVGW